MNLISNIIAANLIKAKIHIFIYALWNTYFLSSFSSLLFLFVFFFCLIFDFFKPKLFYQYLFESSRKQQLRGILLNIHIFNLINSKKLCISSATFFNSQETFQCNLDVVVRVIRRLDIRLYQINVETTLCMSTLKFTTLNNFKATISTLVLTTLDNIETMLLFSTSSFITLINFKTT